MFFSVIGPRVSITSPLSLPLDRVQITQPLQVFNPHFDSSLTHRLLRVLPGG